MSPSQKHWTFSTALSSSTVLKSSEISRRCKFSQDSVCENNVRSRNCRPPRFQAADRSTGRERSGDSVVPTGVMHTLHYLNHTTSAPHSTPTLHVNTEMVGRQQQHHTIHLYTCGTSTGKINAPYANRKRNSLDGVLNIGKTTAIGFSFYCPKNYD
jgi:hypothetical protein